MGVCPCIGARVMKREGVCECVVERGKNRRERERVRVVCVCV